MKFIDFVWAAFFLIVLSLIAFPVLTEEPKHINVPVEIQGENATMKLEFWKHVVDTLDWQADKINKINVVIFMTIPFYFT